MLNRSETLVDPLSDVLSLLRLCNIVCGAVDSGSGCVEIPAHDGIKCYSVIAGNAWLAVEGEEDVQLHAGDCFILPRGLPFRIASDLTLDPVDYRLMLAGRSPGHITTFNGGGCATLVGGVFSIDGRKANMLFDDLPSIIHVRADGDRAALRLLLDLMMQELRSPRPGSRRVIEHLAEMMLVQALREFLDQEGSKRVGWLFALTDRRIGTAIGAIHADPAHRWTLQALAMCASMSRTSFATRFKQTVGHTPIEYLTRWRMMLAVDRLSNSCDPILVIAESVGYKSESAFSHAFKRSMGCAPRQYANGTDSNNYSAPIVRKSIL